MGAFSSQSAVGSQQWAVFSSQSEQSTERNRSGSQQITSYLLVSPLRGCPQDGGRTR